MKCPFCAEEIQDGATKCRFCGEWLDGRGQAVDLILTVTGTTLIEVIREVFSLRGSGLRDAKLLVDEVRAGRPQVVLSRVTTEEANVARERIERVGGSTEVVPSTPGGRGTPPAPRKERPVLRSSRCYYCKARLKRGYWDISYAVVCGKCGREQPWAEGRHGPLRYR